MLGEWRGEFGWNGLDSKVLYILATPAGYLQ